MAPFPFALPPLVFPVVALALLSGCAHTVRERIYNPEKTALPAQWGNAPPRNVEIVTSDGLRLAGYYWAPRNPAGNVIVFFSGRSGNRDTAGRMAQPLAGRGDGLLVASYRGYGNNPGTPSETGLINDGLAFTTLARQLAPQARITVFGFSLGGAVALECAARMEVGAVMTLGTFTSLKAVTPGIARPVLPDRYDNLTTIAHVNEPVVIFHGTADKTVPFANAEALQAATGGKAVLVPLEGAGHLVDFNQLAPKVWQQLDRLSPQADPDRPSTIS